MAASAAFFDSHGRLLLGVQRRVPDDPRGVRALRYWRRLDEDAREAVRDVARQGDVVDEPEVALLAFDLLDQAMEAHANTLWYYPFAWLLLLLAVMGFALATGFDASDAFLGFVGGVAGGLLAPVLTVARYEHARASNAAVARAAGLLG